MVGTEVPAKPSVARDLINLVAGALLALSVFDASSAVQVSLALAVGALAMGLALTRRSLGRPDLYFAALAGLTLASQSWTLYPPGTTIAVITQFGCLAIFLLVRAAADHARSIRVGCLGFLTGCCVAVLDIYNRVGSIALSGLTDDRSALEGLNSNYLAYAFATGLALCAILWHLRLINRLLTLGFALVLLVGINMAGARAALLAAGLLAAWPIIVRLSRRAIKILLVLLVGVAAAIGTGYIDIVSQFIRRTDRETGDLNNRLPTWARARELFLDHPFFGTGAGSFRGLNEFGIVAHNGFLEVASGLGLAGLVLLIASLYSSLVSSSRPMDPKQRALVIGSFIAVTAPCLLSGNWVQSPAMWGAIALISRIPLALPETRRDDLRTPQVAATK